MFNVSLICNLIFCMSEPKISGLSKSILWSVTNECLYTEQKFTVETEKDNHLPFLDVLITRTEDGLINTTLEFVHQMSSPRKKLDLSKIYCSVMATLTTL